MGQMQTGEFRRPRSGCDLYPQNPEWSWLRPHPLTPWLGYQEPTPYSGDRHQYSHPTWQVQSDDQQTTPRPLPHQWEEDLPEPLPVSFQLNLPRPDSHHTLPVRPQHPRKSWQPRGDTVDSVQATMGRTMPESYPAGFPFPFPQPDSLPVRAWAERSHPIDRRRGPCRALPTTASRHCESPCNT